MMARLIIKIHWTISSGKRSSQLRAKIFLINHSNGEFIKPLSGQIERKLEPFTQKKPQQRGSTRLTTQKFRSFVLSEKEPRQVSLVQVRLAHLRFTKNCWFWYRSSKDKSPKARICKAGKPLDPKAQSTKFTNPSASELRAEGLFDMTNSSRRLTSESYEWSPNLIERSVALVLHNAGWNLSSGEAAFERVLYFLDNWVWISARIFRDRKSVV